MGEGGKAGARGGEEDGARGGERARARGEGKTLDQGNGKEAWGAGEREMIVTRARELVSRDMLRPGGVPG